MLWIRDGGQGVALQARYVCVGLACWRRLAERLTFCSPDWVENKTGPTWRIDLMEAAIFAMWSDKLERSSDQRPAKLFGYDVLGRLGEGAASVIYAVSEPKTGQVYALKHVIRRSEKDDRFIAQVENEYEVSQGFKHPALRRSVALKLNRTFLRKIVDAGLVMELVDGTPLDQQLPEDIGQVVNVFKQAAGALGALHYLRFVHCDFKPHNIMVLGDGSIKLVDFGQAAPIGTVKERVQGTPDFIAPEQVKRRTVTERTDIYSFGASLYWALTGKRVPTLFTVEKQERKLLVDQAFSSPAQLRPEIGDALSRLVMECVNVHPQARPATMGEVARRLETNGRSA
jgi:eukaryotic-like serine/threonine-protein kinase